MGSTFSCTTPGRAALAGQPPRTAASDTAAPPPVFTRSAASSRPTIGLLATGGTIAGVGESAVNSATYRPAQVPIDMLLAGVPGLQEVATVRGVQVYQVSSESLTNDKLVELARHVSSVLKDRAMNGVVITHGTDTLEETAYFLNLVIHSPKPIVVVGSMRPSTAMSADGQLNLYNAVVVAASKQSRGKGVMIVMNDDIMAGRDTSKRVNVKTNAFSSQWGSLGMVVEGRTHWFRELAKRHTDRSEFDIDEIDRLANVQIVYGSLDMSAEQYDGAVKAGAQAIVHAGTGNGSVPAYLVDKLRRIGDSGIPIIRASRVPDGLVLRNAEQPDDRYGWVVAHDLNPQKAKVLAAVALAKPIDPTRVQPRTTADLQRIYWEY